MSVQYIYIFFFLLWVFEAPHQSPKISNARSLSHPSAALPASFRVNLIMPVVIPRETASPYNLEVIGMLRNTLQAWGPCLEMGVFIFLESL